MSYKGKRAKATDIPQKVKKIVWERDGHRCIFCGNPEAMPNAHVISRAKGGLGIPENVVTLCRRCHDVIDNSTHRLSMLMFCSLYLSRFYPGWTADQVTFKKGNC